MMELIIPFKKTNFSPDGVNLLNGKFILDIQSEWERDFHNKFNPYYANLLTGHPLAMKRLTEYLAVDRSKDSNADFGMELIDGQIDIDTNLAIEKFSQTKTIYAIGSRFQADDEPIFLIKNKHLSEEILVMSYYSDSEEEDEKESVPVSCGFLIKK
ncbi:MAG: hypothetical protein WCL21_02145 [Mariniphaga sp.]